MRVGQGTRQDELRFRDLCGFQWHFHHLRAFSPTSAVSYSFQAQRSLVHWFSPVLQPRKCDTHYWGVERGEFFIHCHQMLADCASRMDHSAATAASKLDANVTCSVMLTANLKSMGIRIQDRQVQWSSHIQDASCCAGFFGGPFHGLRGNVCARHEISH